MDQVPRRKWTQDDEDLLTRLKQVVKEAEQARDSSDREDSGRPGPGAESQSEPELDGGN
jgi:hypothetical protein